MFRNFSKLIPRINNYYISFSQCIIKASKLYGILFYRLFIYNIIKYVNINLNKSKYKNVIPTLIN